MKELWQEALDALSQVWFVQSLIEQRRTKRTLSFRLDIGTGLFVQVFVGMRTDVLYFSLVKDEQRIFGIDREQDKWHRHPYHAPELHEPLAEGLEPRPLFTFLSQVERLIWEHDLL